MTTLVFVAAFCFVAVLVYMLRYSGRVRVVQTRLIDAPLEAVFCKVQEFGQWQQWNPWLDAFADKTLEISTDDRSRCSWESVHRGSGTIVQVRTLERQSIEQRLRLRHPFSVSGKSQWKFREVCGKTEVTWTLRGRVTFSMRAFSSTVQSSLALDCRYGLDRLASLLEPATALRYSVVCHGLREVASSQYVYRSYQGVISGVPEAMRNALGELRQELQQCGVKATGAPIVLYFKTNIKLKTTVCHMGFPVDELDRIGSLPVRAMSAHRAYVVILQGGVAALEIAWYLAMQRLVADKLQADQRLPPFERYLVNSDGTPENECVTELYLPVLSPR